MIIDVWLSHEREKKKNFKICLILQLTKNDYFKIIKF